MPVAVSYELLIGGAAAPPDLLPAVRRIEVEEHTGMAAILRLSLTTAVTEDGSGWLALDDELFPRFGGIAFSVTVGSDAAARLIDGKVVETRASFSADPGESTLDVVAIDDTVLMNLEEKLRPWPNMADSDIAEQIFGEYGLTPVVERTEPTRSEDDVVPIQRGTDIQYLRMLAERNGYECYVAATPSGGEGHFHPPRLDDSPQGVLTVNFGDATNVGAFSVVNDMLRPTTADAGDVDAATLEAQTTSVGSVAQRTLGGSSLLAGEPRKVVLSHTGLAKTGELQTYAQAVVDRAAWGIRAEGDLDVMTYGGVLRAGKPVTVRGVGRLHSGTYYVERVLHAFGEEGYQQSFTLRRNAVKLEGSEDFTDTGALAS